MAEQAMARLKIGRSALYDLLRTRRLVSLSIGEALPSPRSGSAERAHCLDVHLVDPGEYQRVPEH
ncbi:excisionase [Streptomyces sp. V4I2]|uniref:excisionase n=1 Tax=Streptomyces sp. V4I2 TaxID=3042280 RepID=UPI00277DA2E0|nr:excisionase [Streptomyces sp. V4I2]MDQ1047453.1 hypothetical protein [Streptomyces sp. V4I2]